MTAPQSWPRIAEAHRIDALRAARLGRAKVQDVRCQLVNGNRQRAETGLVEVELQLMEIELALTKAKGGDDA